MESFIKINAVGIQLDQNENGEGCLFLKAFMKCVKKFVSLGFAVGLNRSSSAAPGAALKGLRFVFCC